MSQESADSLLDDEMRDVTNDIRIAEEQIARGKGMEHNVAKARVLSRLVKHDKAPLTS